MNDKLSELAMKFRGYKNHPDVIQKRTQIAKEYAEEVDRLIKNNWDEIPTLEDQLPDEWMPDSFFKYWKIR